jgi:molecular chaperone DnaJ
LATDYYELLGVGRDASEDTLKRAYRQLARELHPDANGGDQASEARFKEITVAYETLRDPERRRRYDMFGPDGGGQQAQPGDFFGAGLGDLFESFFGANRYGGGGRAAGPRRGEDVEVLVELAFEEAVFGTSRSVAFRGMVPCEECSASGAAPGTSVSTCRDCGGAGQVRRVRQSILGQVVTTTPCPRCRGAGEVIDSPCPVCKGEGRHAEERSVAVEVPPGVDDGSTLLVEGQGAPAPRGGLSGDLYVHLRVAPPSFERAGTDLVSTLHLAFTQASLGAEVEIETLDGPEKIVIPAATQSGKIFRLRGRGVPHVRSRGRGDLHVRVVVDTPEELTKEQEQLLRDLAALRGEAVAQGSTGFFSKIRSGLS